jgi:hypothetical protein
MIRLTVTDPTYRGRVLAIHEGLDALTLHELRRIYAGLGYPPRCLQVDAADREEVA